MRLEERLPSKTLLYVTWRGSAQRDPVRSLNPLLKLGTDPQFLHFQKKTTEEVLRVVSPGATQAAAWKEWMDKDTGDTVFAWLEGDEKAPKSQDADAAAAAAMSRMVFVYHNVSKIDFDAYWKDVEKLSGTEKTSVTPVEIGGRSAKKITIQKAVYYNLAAGDYILQAGSPEMLQELLARIEAKTPPADSITQNAFWKASRSQVQPGASLELFARFPDLGDVGSMLPPGAVPPGVDFTGITKALHFDRFHGLVSTLHFEEGLTRVRSSLLGDAAAGSLFDLFAPGAASFRSAAAAPAAAQWYAAYRLDFAALYMLIRSVVEAAAPGGQGPATVELAEAGAMAQIGMSISDALKLFTGEFGIYPVETGPEVTEAVFVAGIENSEGVLKVLRLLLASTLTSEDPQGTTTFLTFATDYTDPKTQAKRKRFQTIGVTPTAVILAPRKTMVREAIARMAAASPSASLAAQQNFVASRGRLPQQLSGLAFFDLSKMEWEKLTAQGAAALQDVEKKAAEQQQKNPTGPKPPDFKVSEIFKGFPAALLKQYLHTAAGGLWKDARGVHYESILD